MKNLIKLRAFSPGIFTLDLKMRLTLGLIFIALFQMQAHDAFGQKERVTMNLEGVTIENVFDKIEAQTEYKFFVNVTDIDLNKIVSVKAEDKMVSTVLKELFKDSNISYAMIGQQIVLTRNMEEMKPARKLEQREYTVTGQVVSDKGEPIMGATVVYGAYAPRGVYSASTSTDLNGNFRITYRATEEDDQKLSAFYLGYEPQIIQVNGKSQVNFILKIQVSDLEEVLVVGYGRVKKKDLTGSVSTVKAMDIEQVKTQSVERALYGKVPGVMVTGTGEPGSSASVVIRGLSQINGDNQPLYVVDGIPMNVNANSRDFYGLLNSGNKSNPLLSINPSDIENVTVLKDASAAAIYGSRAANGVIIITTKRGQKGQKPRFTFGVSSTWQNPQTRFDFLSTDEFKQFYTDQAQIALDNSRYPEAWWPAVHPNEMAIINDPGNFFGDADTDWQDEVNHKDALWMDYRFSLSGGSENVNYYMSANVQNQDGVFINSGFKRYSMNANIDATISSKFKMGGSLNYNNSINKTSDLTSFRYAGAFRPDIPVYDEDGNFTDSGYLAFGLQPDINPVGQDGEVRTETLGSNIIATVYGELEIVKNLELRSQISANVNNDEYNSYEPSFTIGALLTGLNGDLISFGDPAIGILTRQYTKSKNIIFSNTLTYDNTFADKHHLNALLGISWDSSENEATGVNFAGFPDDYVLTNPGSATHTYNGNSDYATKALNSFFGRVNYNFDDKYLATLTGRADRSTQFGKENRTGFFPSLGLAWNIHNETFLESSSFLDVLKFRATAGRTGNDNLPAFLFRPVMAVESGFGAPTMYNGLNGFRLQGVSNHDIRWEETDQIDIALEFGMFNNRLNGEIVWFEKNTSDLILMTPISAQTGFPNYYSNIADISNKGWEFLIGGDVVRNKDFRWNSSLNFSFIRNNVDALKGGQSDGFSNWGVVEGYPIGTIKGRDILKTAQTQEEIDALNAGAPDGQYDAALLAPGDFIARDVNGDGEYTADDNVVLADGNQADVFGGWNNTMTYKDFDFSFNFQFVEGIDKVRRPDEFLSYIDFNRMNNYIRDDVQQAWTPDNPDAKYPRAGSRFWQSNTSRYVSDASYISLRSASIGYNVPSRLLEVLGIMNAKFTLTGNNLFLIHDYDGPNPESILRGVNNTQTIDAASDGGWGYPNVQSYTLGLNITF